jgi:hypothetical protein
MANQPPLGVFAGNFLSAFTQAKQLKEQKEDTKKERDARTKLFELQLKREQAAIDAQEQQRTALSDLFSKMQGGAQPGAMGPPNGIPGTAGPVSVPGAATKPTSLTDMLADPQTAMLMLRTGLVKGDDVIKAQQSSQNRAMLQELLGGKKSGGGVGGLELSALKVGPEGQLMPDFEPPRAWQEVRSPDGKSFITMDRQGRPLATRPAAPNEMPQPTEEDKRVRDIDTALSLYEQAKEGLISGLEGTVTGPLIGKAPAITSKQQTAQGSIAAMAPVLKQLFRAAGEGVFTDKDQELLIQMIPTRETNPEARKAMLENIDAIVRAKLGMGAGGKTVDFSQLPP